MNSNHAQPHQPAPSPEDVGYWVRAYAEIAHGNADAQSLLIAWAGFCHTIDDAIDQDKTPDPEIIVAQMLHWTEVVAENAFFKQNQATLTAFVMASANVFIDSARWEKSDDEKRKKYANAYRSFWCEMVYHVAYLVGGYGHMREMSQRYRDMAWRAQHDEISLPLLEEPVPKVLERVPIRPKLITAHIRTQQDWERLETFAKSFEHDIDKRFNYLVVKNAEDRWIGYALMVCVPGPGAAGLPLVVTAWHKNSSPRECVEGMKLLTSWAIVSYGGAATVSTPESPLLPYMEKLGYRDWNMRLFVTD